MKIFVRKVRKNFGKLGEICHEAWIDCILNSGDKIEIFDPDCRIPTDIENHYIEILINIWHLKKTTSNKNSKTGTYLGLFKISEEWLKLDKDLKKHSIEGKHAIQSNDGIFLVKPKYINDLSINIGEEINFYGTRYDLCAWHLIE